MEGLSATQLLYIFAGGGSGSLLRYLCGYLVSRALGAPTPWATWGINILGSLLIGYLLSRASTLPAESAMPVRALLIVGLCGGFTTFSTFSAELLGLLRAGRLLESLLYLGMSVGISLLAVLLGGRLAGQ